MINIITNKELKTVLEQFGAFDIWPKKPTEQTLFGCLDNNQNLLLGEFRDGILAGYLFGFLVQKLSSIHATLDSIEVLPSFRRQGIARELMKHFFIHAANVWCVDNISLFVNPENSIAMDSYKVFPADSLGFFFNGAYNLNYLTWQNTTKIT